MIEFLVDEGSGGVPTEDVNPNPGREPALATGSPSGSEGGTANKRNKGATRVNGDVKPTNGRLEYDMH